MPEIIIKYKNKKTLQALHDFAKYFDYSIKDKKDKNIFSSIKKGNKNILLDDAKAIISELNMDAKELRDKAWKR